MCNLYLILYSNCAPASSNSSYATGPGCLPERPTSISFITVMVRTALKTWANILVKVVSFDHIASVIKDSTSDATAHARHDNFNEISRFDYWNGLHINYNNHRYYCWTEKLMLHRNGTSHSIPNRIVVTNHHSWI